MALEPGFVETNGIRLHYLAAGDSSARPVVLLHGNTHCGGIWAPLIESLASQGYRAYGVSLRGHGLSDKPDSGYDWMSLKDDTIGLLDGLGIESALFVAHSRGGGVTLATALYHPGRVRGVIAYEPTVPLRRGDGPPANMRAPAGLVERTERRRTHFPSREFLFDYYRQRDIFKNWRDDYLWAYIDHGHEAVEGGVERLCPGWVEGKLYEAMVDDSAWRGRTCPGVPVSLIFGDSSGRMAPGRDPAGPIQAVFPRATVGVMANASHFGPMEHPDVWERLVLEFESQI